MKKSKLIAILLIIGVITAGYTGCKEEEKSDPAFNEFSESEERNDDRKTEEEEIQQELEQEVVDLRDYAWRYSKNGSTYYTVFSPDEDVCHRYSEQDGKYTDYGLYDVSISENYIVLTSQLNGQEIYGESKLSKDKWKFGDITYKAYPLSKLKYVSFIYGEVADDTRPDDAGETIY